MGIFIVFVLSRALHPMVIDYSKVDGKMLYSKNSPAIMSFLTRKTNKGEYREPYKDMIIDEIRFYISI